MAKGTELSYASALKGLHGHRPALSVGRFLGGVVCSKKDKNKNKQKKNPQAVPLGLSLVSISTVSWPSYRTAKAGKASPGSFQGRGHTLHK